MKKLLERYGKKKVYIVLATALVVACAVGVAGTVVYVNSKKQAILDSIYIKFIENPTIEYGAETVDYQSFIEESVGEVTVPTETIDTKEIGLKEFTYKVSKEGYEKEEKVSVEVKDTKAPEITLKGETVIVEVGTEFDPKSNIESVADPVDGAIEEYEVTHNIDINVAGEYTVTIKATDKNGNVTEKPYTVVVKEKEAEQSVSSQVNGGSSYNGGYVSRPTTPSYGGSNNQPSGGSGSNNSSSCNVNPNQLGNSGMIFSTEEEARAYGMSVIENENSGYLGFSYGAVHNDCGLIVGYTVNFE
ncbi:MAG: DUF5011 domain-containing protein [Erysipelotrichaceae bacterium]|nr:DUF5011 domain-containing protein [Erysipelotrichaceae bacterium]